MKLIVASIIYLVSIFTIANAQSFPNKPIRIITSDSGGASDVAARLIAPALSASLGQSVYIDNRSGAGAITAIEAVAQASPDGSTLLLFGNPAWLMQLMRKNLPWDINKDFSAVTLVATQPNVLVVNPSLPVKNTQDLIKYARANPGKLNYGTGSPGASSHLAAELFNSMAKVDIVRIPYKGGGQAVLGLLGGQTQIMFATSASVKSHIEAGKLRALAVTSLQPSPIFPQLPTVAQAGLNSYEALSIYALFAPAKTPQATINLLNKEITAILKRPEVIERLLQTGSESTPTTPEEMGKIIRDDIARWSEVMRKADFKAD
jgi:tripartite-type tricarboxylate transporter receptor subunit TctC